MEKKHKDIIRNNYVKLTDILRTDVDTVCSYLFQSKIISSRIKEDIQVLKTPHKKAEHLLDLIQHRGPRAFHELIKAVHEAELQEAADILQSDEVPRPQDHQDLTQSVSQPQLHSPGQHLTPAASQPQSSSPNQHLPHAASLPRVNSHQNLSSTVSQSPLQPHDQYVAGSEIRQIQIDSPGQLPGRTSQTLLGAPNQLPTGAVSQDLLDGNPVPDEDETSECNFPKDFPEKWPSGNHISLTTGPLKTVLQGSSMYKIYNEILNSQVEKGYYTMSHKQKGRMLIINNDVFIKDQSAPPDSIFCDHRIGSSYDREGLRRVFDQLGFTVDIRENLKALDMRRALDDECARDHSSSNCFILVILSHGLNGSVCGTDAYYTIKGNEKEINNCVKIKEIRNMICRVQSLVGKPKLFFIQACRGDKTDPGVKEMSKPGNSQTPEAGDRDDDKCLKEIMEDLSPKTREAHDGPGDIVPTYTDYFVAMATVPDHIAHRDNYEGTWFIQAIVYIFWKHAHERDLLTLMTWVNELVSKAESEHGMKQAAEFTCGLRKKLCFFPGLVSDMQPH